MTNAERTKILHASLVALAEEAQSLTAAIRSAPDFDDETEFRDSAVGMAADYIRVAISELEEIPEISQGKMP